MDTIESRHAFIACGTKHLLSGIYDIDQLHIYRIIYGAQMRQTYTIIFAVFAVYVFISLIHMPFHIIGVHLFITFCVTYFCLEFLLLFNSCIWFLMWCLRPNFSLLKNHVAYNAHAELERISNKMAFDHKKIPEAWVTALTQEVYTSLRSKVPPP